MGMVVNIVLTIAKLLAGVLGHSHALVADAIESLADIFSSAIVWRGIVVAAEPADEDHPYGHGKAEPIAAAIVATMLLFAAIWIVSQAVYGIIHPHEVPRAYTLIVLLVVIAIKEILARYVMSEGVEMDSLVVKNDATHHRSDVIASFAAGIGITIAIIGGKGYESADDYAALIAAGVVAWNGIKLLRPAMDELMDTSPDTSLNKEIISLAKEIAGVDGVEKCLVRKMGMHYFVDMHVEVDRNMPVHQAHAIAHDVKDRIMNKLNAVRDVLVHIEPSVRE